MGLQMLEASTLQIEQIITILALERELKCEAIGRVCITTIPWNHISIPNAMQLADMFKLNHSTWLEWVNATAHLEANITKGALQIIQLQNIAAFKIGQVKIVEHTINTLTDTVSSWLPSWKWWSNILCSSCMLACLTAPLLNWTEFHEGIPSPPRGNQPTRNRRRRRKRRPQIWKSIQDMLKNVHPFGPAAQQALQGYEII